MVNSGPRARLPSEVSADNGTVSAWHCAYRINPRSRCSSGNRLRPETDLPLPAKAVEVVDEAATEETLQCFIDIVDVYALFQHLIPIDIDEDLWNGRAKGR